MKCARVCVCVCKRAIQLGFLVALVNKQSAGIICWILLSHYLFLFIPKVVTREHCFTTNVSSTICFEDNTEKYLCCLHFFWNHLRQWKKYQHSCLTSNSAKIPIIQIKVLCKCLLNAQIFSSYMTWSRLLINCALKGKGFATYMLYMYIILFVYQFWFINVFVAFWSCMSHMYIILLFRKY